MDKNEAIAAIQTELGRAQAKHAPMHSVHEGYATILEELDELWEEVKKKPKNRSIEQLRNEAIQVGAMALRFVVDLT